MNANSKIILLNDARESNGPLYDASSASALLSSRQHDTILNEKSVLPQANKRPLGWKATEIILDLNPDIFFVFHQLFFDSQYPTYTLWSPHPTANFLPFLLHIPTRAALEFSITTKSLVHFLGSD